MPGHQEPNILFLVEAFRGVVRYPLRTGLTLLGLVIGVAAVVGTVALVSASNRLALTSLSRYGALDLVRVTSPERIFHQGQMTVVPKRVRFEEDDVRRMLRGIPGLRTAGLRVTMDTKIRREAAAIDATVEGAGPRFTEFLPITLRSGHLFDEKELGEGARVAILTERLARELFGGEEPLGAEIRILDQRFVVVGIATLPDDPSGEELRFAWIPFRTALDRLGIPREDAELMVAAPSIERVKETEEAVKLILPHLRAGIPLSSYDLETSEHELEETLAQTKMQATVLGGVALLAMLAAGSGILNTLLVGVRERTREIGTRRALGARRGTILRQFLAEAIILSLPGALAGLAAGVGVAHLFGHIFSSGLENPAAFQLVIGPREAASAVLAAIVVATLAGLWPAWQAARVSPAEALRWE